MPTAKQKLAIKKMSENIGNTPGKPLTLGKILAQAGYSASVCKTPKRVTETKGWQELLTQYFPDEELAQIHRRLLYKQEVYVYKGQVIPTGQPHSDAKYALELLYKLKSRYNIAFSPFDDEDSKLSIAELQEKINEIGAKVCVGNRDEVKYKQSKKIVEEYEKANKVK